MSIQRAEVNCQRCYKLVQLIDSNHASDTNRKAAGKDITNEVFSSDSIYSARNEVMMALEECISAGYQDKTVAERGLKACATCNYETPRIANIILK